MNTTSGPKDTRFWGRLTAVQAMYQIYLTKIEPKEALKNISLLLDKRKPNPKKMHFALSLISILTKNQKTLEKDLKTLCHRDFDSLSVLLKALLVCAMVEIKHSPDIPLRVIISEYLDMYHAFFSGAEGRFIHGVLDKACQTFRGQSE